jgi:hypothetical protein
VYGPDVQAESEQLTQYEPLSPEELDDIVGEPLPERAALSVVNANLLIPVSPVVGMTALAHGATATGVAHADTPAGDAG